MRTVGVIAAPGWIDPTATDIMACWPNQVQVTQTILGPAGFDYSFAALAECEPYLREAAQILVETGAEIVVQVGPAFAYLGGGNSAGARQLQDRLSDAVGVPVLLNGVAVLEQLAAINAHHLALVCPYYATPWRQWFVQFLTDQGFVVDALSGFLDHQLFPDQARIDARHYNFSDQEVLACVHAGAALAPQADAVLVSGAGVRLQPLRASLTAALARPVVGADTALLDQLAILIN